MFLLYKKMAFYNTTLTARQNEQQKKVNIIFLSVDLFKLNRHFYNGTLVTGPPANSTELKG